MLNPKTAEFNHFMTYVSSEMKKHGGKPEDYTEKDFSILVHQYKTKFPGKVSAILTELLVNGFKVKT